MFVYTDYLSFDQLKEYAAEFKPPPAFSRLYLYAETLNLLDLMLDKMIHEVRLAK